MLAPCAADVIGLLNIPRRLERRVYGASRTLGDADVIFVTMRSGAVVTGGSVDVGVSSSISSFSCV